MTTPIKPIARVSLLSAFNPKNIFSAAQIVKQNKKPLKNDLFSNILKEFYG